MINLNDYGQTNGDQPHFGQWPNPQQSVGPEAVGAETTSPDKRFELIERLLDEACGETSPVAANLKACGGDLLEMALLLKPLITTALKSCTNVEDLRDVHAYLEDYVKLGRQADRFLRLGEEITRGDAGGAGRKRSR